MLASLPKAQRKALDALASKIINALNADDTITCPIDLKRFARKVHVKLEQLALDDDMLGLLVKPSETESMHIVTDTRLSRTQRRIIIARAFGVIFKENLTVHDKVGYVCYGHADLEHELNVFDDPAVTYFARALLMPKGIIEKLWADDERFENIAGIFGVGYGDLGLRCEDLGLTFPSAENED